MKANELKLFLGLFILIFAGLTYAGTPWYWADVLSKQYDFPFTICEIAIRTFLVIALAGGLTAVVSYFRNGNTVNDEKGK